MNFFFHVYDLIPKDPWKESFAARKGALLRFQFEDLGLGYADCHPWPELGDDPWETQIARLARGEFTALTRRSITLARADAEARALGAPLVQSLAPIKNHFLIPSLRPFLQGDFSVIENAAALSFRILKIKAGQNLENEARVLRALRPLALTEGLKIRLDLNEKLELEQALKFLDESHCDPSWIDLLEDPVPYDCESWLKLKRSFAIPLAVDRPMENSLHFIEPESFDVLVLKPAIQSPQHALSRAPGKPVMVTSYLDHPVGQIGAAWAASSLLSRVEVISCGLLSHLIYEESNFSKLFHIKDTHLFCGNYDEVLKRLSWQSST